MSNEDPPETRQIDLEIKFFREAHATGGAPAILNSVRLNLSEMEFITCEGASSITSFREWSGELADEPRGAVAFPRSPVCGIFLRTLPLDEDPSLPVEAIGQGALLEGINSSGMPFSVVLRPQVFVPLVPTMNDISVENIEALHLEINETAVLEAVLPYTTSGGVIVLPEAQSGSASSPREQLERSFALKQDVQGELVAIAGPSNNLGEDAAVFCEASCLQANRVGCGADCSPAACEADLQSSPCSIEMAAYLSCELGLDASQLSCEGGEVVPIVPYCMTQRDALLRCGDENR